MELDQHGRQYLERVEPTAKVTDTKCHRDESPRDRGPGALEGIGSSSDHVSCTFHTVSDVLRQAFRFPSVTASAVAAGSLETTCRLKIESVERFSGDINRVRDELDEAGAGQEVFVVCQTEAEVRRLVEIFSGTQAAGQGRLHFPIGALHSGFRLVPDRIVLLSSGELFRRADLRRPARRRLSRVIDSFLELREGDLVVHVGHGIARYRGLKLLEKNGQVEEHLELEFHGHTKLYVPSTKIGLVQKYIGGTKSRPTLAKLGGRLWGRQKERGRGSGDRPGGRHAGIASGTGLAAGHRLSRRYRMAAGV